MTCRLSRYSKRLRYNEGELKDLSRELYNNKTDGLIFSGICIKTSLFSALVTFLDFLKWISFFPWLFEKNKEQHNF